MRRVRLLLALLLASSLALAAAAGPSPDRLGRGPAPELAGDFWINSEPLTLAGLRGRVVLVEFWTFACRNCQHVEPWVKDWHVRYADLGLTVVAVHTPELSRERDPGQVRAYVRAHDLRHPILVDGEYVTWRRYGNRAWPALYLIDRAGRIRYVRVGEGGYEATESWIQQLLAESR